MKVNPNPVSTKLELEDTMHHYTEVTKCNVHCHNVKYKQLTSSVITLSSPAIRQQ